MKGKSKPTSLKWIAIILCCAIVLSVIALVIANTGKSGEVSRPNRVEVDTSYRGWVTVPQEDVVAEAEIAQGGESIGIKEEKCFPITVPETGDYGIVLTYAMKKGSVLDSTVAVTQLSPDGDTVQEVRTEVYSLWQDETKNYTCDRYGNEVTPAQLVLSQDVTDYVRPYAAADGGAAMFAFPKGE